MFGEFMLVLYSIWNIILLVWQLVLFVPLYFNYRLVKVTIETNVELICNSIKYSTYYENDKKRGWFINFTPFYFGVIYETDDKSNSSLLIFCHESTYTKLSETSKQDDKKSKLNLDNSTVELLMRQGEYYNRWLSKRTVTINIKPTAKQINIMEQIIINNKTKSKCKITYLYGPPNTGKSSIGMMLAVKLNGYYALKYNPMRPNCIIENYAVHAETKPVILVVEEIDTIIDSFGKFPVHREYEQEIHDKSSWNTYTDNINNGMYPNVYVILTSNRAPSEYSDQSLFRSGRVNVFHITNDYKESDINTSGSIRRKNNKK